LVNKINKSNTIIIKCISSYPLKLYIQTFDIIVTIISNRINPTAIAVNSLIINCILPLV